METTRFILLIALGLVLTMIWQAWQEDYGVTTPVQTDKETTRPGPSTGIVSLPEAEPSAAEKDLSSNIVESGKTHKQNGEVVHVKTDILDVEINTLGGTIQRLALLEYSISKDKKNEKVVLLDHKNDDFYLVQGGLLSKDEVPNHKTIFKSEKNNYELGDNNSVSVSLFWKSNKGIKVVKKITFYKGQYLADIEYEIQNPTSENWSGRAYGQINRTSPNGKGSRFVRAYTGAVISSPEKRYKKLKFKDIQEEKLSTDITNGWVAMLQHYFFTALIPGSKNEQYHYYTLNPDNRSYVIGAITPPKNIPAGTSDKLNYRVYSGPKLQKDLEYYNYAEGLDLTVDYGFLWFIAKPLYWVMDHIHTYTNNWGWSIILVTLLLKILFYKLSAAGYRSMANMRRVQPRLISIKERYKDDRTRLNKAMMDIYKEEKINPLGGCFPILVQIPVFISLYWVLLESVELRQADFVFWIHDLSAPDPYFVLPLLMGITMFVQQRLNPAPMDPVQQKVMSVLPIVFTVFFAFFPSGLVLYWVVNNTLSIAQQWLITRNLERAGINK